MGHLRVKLASKRCSNEEEMRNDLRALVEASHITLLSILVLLLTKPVLERAIVNLGFHGLVYYGIWLTSLLGDRLGRFSRWNITIFLLLLLSAKWINKVALLLGSDRVDADSIKLQLFKGELVNIILQHDSNFLFTLHQGVHRTHVS